MPDVLTELIEAADNLLSDPSEIPYSFERAVTAVLDAGYPARREAELKALRLLAEAAAHRANGYDALASAACDDAMDASLALDAATPKEPTDG